MEVDLIDWLITKTSALVWRSLSDPTVFKSDDSGFDLNGFEDQPIKTPFHFERCLLTSVEDLFRPRHYDELHRLRPALPGVSVDFLHRQQRYINIDRSRLRHDEIEVRHRTNQSDRLHFMQSGYHSRFGPVPVDVTPPILAESGLDIIRVEEGCDGNFQLVHNLGKSIYPFL